MGERKGTNKYYPPDYDPKKGGLNKFMGTHALRERARKLHLGIMIIRFEMPYNIWCEGCNNHIGMGVRYNAEKKKIGMYYSTPVYQFRMKCHLCDNHFEIKTDPANLDYVIVNGARRQERRWDPNENGQVVPDDKQVIHKLADDAMFKLQHGVEDQKKLKDVTPTLSKLENLQERWKDDYMANKALRDIFRSRKRELQEQHNKDKDFLKKRSLDIPLLQESEDDAKVASLIRLQPALSVDERQQEKRSEIDKKSQFPFPLLGTIKGNSAISTVSTSSVDSSGGQGSSSRTTEQNSCLHQRRLSLGIKLRRDLPSTITTGSTTVTQPDKNDKNNGENGHSSSSDSKVELDRNKIINTESHAMNDDDAELNSRKQSQTTHCEKSCSPSTGNPKNLPDSDTSSSSSNINNAQSSGSSKGFLSSLVSYSDDSENSSENEEIQ